MYLCEYEGSIRGMFDGMAIITDITEISATRLSGNYVEAGRQQNRGTFTLNAIRGSTSQFSGYWQANGDNFQGSWSGSKMSNQDPDPNMCWIPAVGVDNDLNSHWSVREDVEKAGTTFQQLDLCERGEREDAEMYASAYGSGEREPDNYWFLQGEFLDNKKTWVGDVYRGLNLEGDSGIIYAGIGMARQVTNDTAILTFVNKGQDVAERRTITQADQRIVEVWHRYDGREGKEQAKSCTRNRKLEDGRFSFPEVISGASSLTATFVAVASVFAALLALAF